MILSDHVSDFTPVQKRKLVKLIDAQLEIVKVRLRFDLAYAAS